ncbi:MAG: OmpH family outer membrane protein [Candidatus Gastranaerophilales bacterium]|nr:OmpH family outer membrane protein [Candidatus Gastranaerophilales bacterium]
MKNLKLAVTALALLFFTNLAANADTIAYANFKKIESEYAYAKDSYKQIDNKVLELQQYVIDKDKQFKAIDSPIQKKNFEEKIQKEYKDKEDTVLKMKMQKEDEIYQNIMAATKAVAAIKKYDVVLDYRVVFTGGIDISNDIIQYLNSAPRK